MKKRIAIIVAACAGGVMLLSCAGAKRSDSPEKTAAAVKLIDLPHFQSNFPEGPNREVVAVACLSCHSTRYITMQPPMTAAKWEENVRKMIKTYGAPIGEEQVPKIVQYLMATKEAAPAGEVLRWESHTTEPRERAPRVELAERAKVRLEDAQRGAALFASNCASCHGRDGRGGGTSVGTIFPPASDLTAGHYSAQFVADSIYNGVRGAAMPMNRTLLGDDLRAVVTYSVGLGPAAQSVPANPQAAALFAKNCASCHGASGMGDGVAAPPLPRPPANFHLKQPTMERAVRVIGDGIPGSAMAAWKAKLSDADRQMLAEYVRSFYPAEAK